MNQTDYEVDNRAKVSFDAAYVAPTPFRYMSKMAAVGYRMAEEMLPFLSAVVDASENPDAPVKVLDLGCSYGLSASLLKTDCRYGELTELYTDRASIEYAQCANESRRWLRDRRVRNDVQIVGFDSSEEAIRFAMDVDMVDTGIARNLEDEGASLTLSEASAIQGCDVFFSTGAIGYLTDKTINPILDEFGRASHGALGPIALLSVLELFALEPLESTFADHGFGFARLGLQLPQRRFADEQERGRVLDALQRRGLPTRVQEDEDQMLADVCVAARPEQLDALTECLSGSVAARAECYL